MIFPPLVTCLKGECILFLALLLTRKWENRCVHYSILFLIGAMAVTHIAAYNTDAEDTYIGLRYVKNFVDGNGLVFNTFDRVEGYSDCLWLLLIAGMHKILGRDIPLTARGLSLVASLLTLYYSYYVVQKLTKERLISYLAAFLVAGSGMFACYGLSGLENPLFAFFVLLVFDLALEKKWSWAGLSIGLATMTRPEGCLLFLPLALYVSLLNAAARDRMKAVLQVALVAASVGIPWTLWRVWYYGYLIPNTIAAKQGMDLSYQLSIGISYSCRFLLASAPIVCLFVLPIAACLYAKQKINKLWADKSSLYLYSVALLFVAFYTYIGGDWMPAWRFYASVVPLFCVILALIWSQLVLPADKESRLGGFWIAVVFVSFGYLQISKSFSHSNMISSVTSWSNQVNGLKIVGKWFRATLPANTLIATFPNGAFSFYNELPTLDYCGLTDNHVGRFGTKQKVGGWPGHIASDREYVLGKRPDIIAIMDGAGFVDRINKGEEFAGYAAATFAFPNYSNPGGNLVNINIRSDRRGEILSYLLQKKDVKLVQISPP